jgi:hypothetical protein
MTNPRRNRRTEVRPSVAVAYVRVSTGRQAESGLSLEAQERSLRQAAEIAGYAEVLVLRGTALDPVGHTEERKMERRLRDEYVRTIRDLLPKVSPDARAAVLATLRALQGVIALPPAEPAASPAEALPARRTRARSER